MKSSLIALIALTSIVGGCSSDSSEHQGTSGYRDSEKTAAREAAMVEMSASQFIPPEVTIRAGESVLWKNTSSETHTVTADPAKVSNRMDVALPSGAKPFHSGEIRPGKTWKQTFNTPGTYKYVCAIHEHDGMKGTVVVRPTEPAAR